MQFDATFFCAYCGEPNDTTVDASAGEDQSYVEDCQVCCRPNVLTVTIDPDSPEGVVIDAEPESD